MPEEKLPLIGRDRALIDGLAKLVHDAVRKRHEYTDLYEGTRGCTFEVRVLDPDGDPTGRIARIAIELDRVEP